MKPIRTRSDLTDVVARHAPTKACATAMRENRAVVLGGFTAPDTLPCWIVQVTSRHGRQWLFAVECDEANYRFAIRHIDTVPWRHWIGRSDGKRPLIDGDDPVESCYERMKARRR